MTARPVVTKLNTQEAVVGEPYITVYFSAGVCVCVCSYVHAWVCLCICKCMMDIKC